MEKAAKCGDMEFSLEGEEGEETVEGVEKFRYLGRNLHQTDDDWPVVRQKIIWARSIWGRLGTLL